MSKKKITLKNNNGDELYPLTVVQQVEGLQAALDEKLDGSGVIDVVGPINITGTDSTQSKLTFARSLSYISNSGKIGIVPNGQTLSSGYGIWFSNAGIEPGSYMDNSYNMGSSSYKWKNVYAYTFNGTATAVADGCVSTSKIAKTAITPEKIQTSIALNGTPSMTVEPTTSSPDKTIASVGLVKKVVADLEIDTRNLLSNSKEITIDATGITSGTKMLQKKLPISVEVGDVLTFNCEDMIINAGTDQTHAILLYSGGALASVKYISPTSKTATITVTKASSTPYLYMYAGFSDDSAGKSITYKGATLVKGDKPMLLWQPSVEDVQKQLNDTVNDKLEGYASIQYVDNKVASIGTPGNATETGAGIVRAATQAEVTDGHVSDNDPAEMAFVRPETLQSKLSNYPTTTAMTQAINESRQIIYYQSSQPSGGKNGDIWIKP